MLCIENQEDRNGLEFEIKASITHRIGLLYVCICKCVANDFTLEGIVNDFILEKEEIS